MTRKTTDHSHRRLQSHLVLGIFALLGVGEIIFVVTGVQRLDDPKSWIALAGAIFIVGMIILGLVGRAANLVVKWRGPASLARTPSSSLFETRLDGFDPRHEELLRRIDLLPDTGRKTDRDSKRRLLEIAMAQGN